VSGRTGQLVVTIVGTVVGAYFGYPGLGMAIGGALGAVLFPPEAIKSEGPRINDLKIQDSSYGRPIPKAYGVYRIAGNIIWKGPVTEHSNTESQGGKGGGPSSETTTYSYTVSFAVGLVRGPIVGVRRIWANSKLIYNAGQDATVAIAVGSIANVGDCKIYTGSETQMPDPVIESVKGAGNVPAYRGLAYIRFSDFDVTSYGNYLPQLSFEVVTESGDAYVTAIASSWTLDDAIIGANFSAPHITAEGVRAVGWRYFYTWDGTFRQDLNVYTSVPAGVVTGPEYLSFSVPGNSDEPGAFYIANTGLGVTYHWSPSDVGNTVDTTIPGMGGAGGNDSMVKDGDAVWITSQYGAVLHPVYYVPFTGAHVTSSVTGHFALLGTTAGYVYVQDTVTKDILRLDKTTLVLADTIATSIGGAWLGDVISDDEAYVVTITGAVHHVDLTDGSSELLFTASGAPESFAYLGGDLFGWTKVSGDDTIELHYGWKGLDDAGIALSTIVADVCDQAGLDATQYDVSELTDIVRGFCVTNRTSAKAAIQTLLQTYFVDAADTSGKLKFVKRGHATAGTIPAEDLLLVSDDASPLAQTRIQEVELAATMEITYLSTQHDFQNNTQRATRFTSVTEQAKSLTVAVALRDDDARNRVETMMAAEWVARSTFEFSVPWSYLKYEPTDVIVVTDPDDGEAYNIRINRVALGRDNALKISGVLEDQSLYPSGAYPPTVGAVAGSGAATDVGYAAGTALVIVDSPPLRDADDSPAIYAAACGYSDTWPGCVIQVSHDNGGSWASLASQTVAATIGYANDALGDFYGGRIVDELNSVTVSMVHGTLSSTDAAGLLSGTNAAYLNGEIIFFRDATLVSTGVYTLTGLLRGIQGTEWAMGAHAQGDGFVLLSSATLLRLPIALTDINADVLFRAVTHGRLSTTATQITEPITEANIRPLSPVYLEAENQGADIVLAWIRRVRLSATWRDSTDVPLDEATEAYTIKVYDGSTLLRTMYSSGPSATYTAAMLAADGFGGSSETITFTVAQNSDQGILGREATVSLVR